MCLCWWHNLFADGYTLSTRYRDVGLVLSWVRGHFRLTCLAIIYVCIAAER